MTEPEDIARYINMIQSTTLSKTLRYICDDHVKSRMYHFFLQNKDLFTKRDFKHWAVSIYNFKQYRNGDVFKALEQGFVEKFL